LRGLKVVKGRGHWKQNVKLSFAHIISSWQVDRFKSNQDQDDIMRH